MKKNIIPLMGFECENAKIQGRLKRLLKEFEERYKERSLISVIAFLEHAKSLEKRPSWFIFHEWELIKNNINGVNFPVFCNLLSQTEQTTLSVPTSGYEEIEKESSKFNKQPSNYYNDTLQDYKNSSKYRQVIEQLSAEWATPFNTTQEKLIDKTFTENPNIPGYAVLELIKEEYESITKERQPIKPHFFNKKASEPVQDGTLPTIEPSLRERLFAAVMERNEGKTLTPHQIKELNEGFRYMMDQNIHHDDFDKQVEFLYDCI